MTEYVLSAAAELDLERLLEYGIENFGSAVAVDYFDGLVERFESIANSPLQYPEAQDVKEGYRLSVYKSHSVYFRITEIGVEIIRVLNSQDIEVAISRADIC